MPKHLKCQICNTDIDVPVCCEDDMQYQNGKLMCTMCGSKQELQICCGKKMKIVKTEIEENEES